MKKEQEYIMYSDPYCTVLLRLHDSQMHIVALSFLLVFANSYVHFAVLFSNLCGGVLRALREDKIVVVTKERF